jgi:hypothetical protein
METLVLPSLDEIREASNRIISGGRIDTDKIIALLSDKNL